ncbi:MAG TPA: XrtA/PEP-CTERM system histidine kinase PrsK, partial [Candidatus Eisenbacteria bacterium]|nr:XrtA/PEP-CTERM system histidine kinase PrsK [Candidatus Eisenbacteria bacterium]
LNWEVSDLLRTAGRQAASYLAHLEAANALMAAKQFDSFNRMSAFIIHDLKNLVSQLSLLLANAERHHQNPAFQQEMLDTIGNSVDKMKRLLTQLKAASAVTEPPRPLSLGDVVSQAVAQQAGLPIVPQIELVGDTPHVIASGERLARVLGHLIRNAIEATPATGRVTVRVTASAGFALVVVTDTGRGMTEEFIRGRLFRPFESTKPDGMGVGMYECKQYVEELGGRIEVESEIAKGSTFRVWLPLVERVATEVVA